MTTAELSLSLSALACSSVAQLFMKSFSTPGPRRLRLAKLALAGCLQLISVALAVIVLQTLPLSRLIPFAAGAYFLVPLGSCYFLGESLHPRFWLGAVIIIVGIIITQT